MDKLENLKKGKRFSSEYQPSNYRKQRLFTKIACMLGDEKFSVTFSKKDFYDIYQTLASMTRKELIELREDENTPVFMISLINAIDKDCAEGNNKTIEMMFDRLFGRAAQSTDITSGGEKITVNPPKIVFTDDYEDDPDNDDEGKLLN